MTLQQKILAAMANSTSRTPMSTDEVRGVVGKERVLTDLEALRDKRKVGHCQITKGGAAVDFWWLAGNVRFETLPQTAARNRKTTAAKARKAAGK